MFLNAGCEARCGDVISSANELFGEIFWKIEGICIRRGEIVARIAVLS